MESPLVSVIVPVYNAATHIGRCLDSIRKQTHQNLEIILVNDGSQDVSLSVCEMYARVDDRIRLVDKANSGVSATRNLAMSMATGKYLQFVDSDDYLDPNATRLLVQSAEEHQADMVIAHYFRVTKVHVTPKMPEKKEKTDVKPLNPEKKKPEKRELVRRFGFLDEGFYDKTAFANRMIEKPGSFYYGVLWNKLYRRDIVETHNLRCSEELFWSEDLLFNVQYMRYAARFYSLQTPVYYYVQNPQSITNSKMRVGPTITTRTCILAELKDLYEEMGLYEENKFQIYGYLVSGAETLKIGNNERTDDPKDGEPE